MLTYFNGYNFVDEKEGECDRCCIPLDPGCGYGYDRLNWNDWARYASWFLLFKELEFITRDDTVYTYLCAKGNWDLDPYCYYGWNKDSPLYEVRQRWGRDIPEGVKALSSIKYDHSGSDFVDFKFPKELIKMADNYRVGRTVEFIEKLVYAACYSEIGTAVTVGTRLPKAVITAVEGFNPVVSSLNSIVENCKALYASAIPETYGGYSSTTQHGSSDSILRYDPSRNDAVYNPDKNDCIIGQSFIKCHRYLIELLRERLLIDMAEAVVKRDLATCNQLREAITTVIGVLVYINALANGYSVMARSAFINTQSVFAANMMTTKDGADQNKIFSMYDKPRPEIATVVGTMMGASPDAALCIGNMAGEQSYSIWDYRFNRLGEYLAERRAKPSLIIGNFLRYEAEFQYNMKRIALDRVKRFKEGAGK